MRIADRDARRIVTAPLTPRHWRALAGIMLTVRPRFTTLLRYLTNRGQYPCRLVLRTPLGPVSVTVWDRHDLLTINEVFFRRDYGSSPHRTVVDIGGNRGYATLFFLTRDADTRVWIFEPDPENVEKLRRTLSGFTGRYHLVEKAVTPDEVAAVRFVPNGRYGRIAREGETGIEVAAISIASVIRDVAAEAGEIDLVKIDTEGTEPELVAALARGAPVREVRYEDIGRIVAFRPAET